MSASIELGWNNGKLQAGAAGAAAIVDKASARMKGALASIGKSVASGVGVGAGVGIFNSITSSIKAIPIEIAKATISFDSMRIGMEVIEGSASGAAQRISELQDLAKLPGLGFQQTVEGDIRLRSAGISASVSKKAIEEMGNALAAVGKGKGDMDGVILALSQIASKGKVSAEEINQIAERVPQIRAILKGTFGTADTEAIQKMGIPVESFITLVVDGFSRTVPRAIVGLQGKIDNFSDAAQMSMAAFGAGIAEEMIGPLDTATESMGSLSERFEELGSFAGDFANRWSRQFDDLNSAVGGSGDSLLQSFANLFAANYWQQEDALIEKSKKLADVISRQKAETDKATDSITRAAAQDKEWAKQRDELNNALDLYVAKQDAANASAEQSAVASAKQAEELAKLQEQLDQSAERTLNSSLSPKMQQQREIKKLDKLDNEIDYASIFGDEERVIRLKTEREGVLLRIGDLEKQIKLETQKQVDEDERLLKQAKDREDHSRSALQMLDLELAILNAQASGHDKKAKQLEHERDVQEETARIVADTGLAYADAAKKAEQLVSAKERVDGRKDGNGRRKIHGYSQDQGDGVDTIGAGFRRAESRRNDARERANSRVNEFMGMDSMSPSRLAPRGDIGAKTPATDAPKASGESELATLFKAYSDKTVEIFEKALA